MSQAVPFNLLSFHASGSADPVATRLKWPIAGSLAIHVVVLFALVGLRFAPSLERPSGSYQVVLVTLPEISPPRPARSRAPERVTDSLGDVLESVVVPKLRTMTLTQKEAMVPVPPPPLRQLPAFEMESQTIQVPPQPPKLASGPETRKSKRATPPRVDPLTPTLKQAVKQAVGPIVVAKKQNQTSGRVAVSPVAVSPTVKSDGGQKQDTGKTPRSSDIILPAPAPRPAAVTPLSQKKETPVETPRKSPTAESLTKTYQSIRIPENKKPQPPEIVSEAVPLLPEASPKHPTTAEDRDPYQTVVPPPAPQLARMIESEPVPSRISPMTTPKSEPDQTLTRKIIDLPIPQGQASETGQQGPRQTESSTQEMPMDMRVKGSCSKENVYWGKVENKIDRIWRKGSNKIAGRWILDRAKIPRSQSLRVVLDFRVERNGHVKEPTVVRSSGNELFDSAAKRAVKKANPLPPFPETMPRPFCDVRHTFID